VNSPSRRALIFELAAVASALLSAPVDADAPPGPPPSASQCDSAEPQSELPPITSYDARPGTPRIFAIQFKQSIEAVTSYTSFRTRIECLIRQDVVPRLAQGRPNVVVFNEDIGLATIAIGTRGAAARAIFGAPGGLSCEPEGIPCATLGALAAVTASYVPQLAYYRLRFGDVGTLSGGFVAATDTIVRGFVQTFSELARRYGIYIIASGDLPDFTQSSDPATVALLADPDLHPAPSSVYVASDGAVHNATMARSRCATSCRATSSCR
jgi:hypothetical protein